MFLRFLTILSAVLFCGVLAAAAEPTVAERVGAGEAASAELFGPKLKELLTLLRQRQLVAPLDPALDRAVGEALLHHVGCGARYAEPAGGVVPPVTPRTVLLRNRYLYCWLPAIAPESAGELETALPAKEPGKALDGIIVDLRGAAQGTPEGVNRLVALLTAQTKPLILLLNPDTAGPAEILAVLLRRGAGTAWVGQSTRGCFAFSEPVTLATGDRVLLPRAVREFAGVEMPGAALAPDVTVEPGPAGENPAGLTAERFEAFPERDPALRAALDLLTTIQALKHKEPAAAPK